MHEWKSLFPILVALATAFSKNCCVGAFEFDSGVSHELQEGELVKLKVNAMTSIHTQIPKDYYRLPFCLPMGGPRLERQNIGQFLTGNRIQTSSYEIQPFEDSYCQKLCQVKLSEEGAVNLREHIKYNYHHNWIVYNLPSAYLVETNLYSYKHFAGGFPIGYLDENKIPYINNHVNIYIETSRNHVTGFWVEPLSIKHKFKDDHVRDVGDYLDAALSTCSNNNADGKGHTKGSDNLEAQIVAPGETILYTYDVIWSKSTRPWTHRWDIYLTEDYLVPNFVHLYSIYNSIIAFLILTALILCTLVRSLRRDIAEYDALAAQQGDEENDNNAKNDANADHLSVTGWKAIHADVFRPPDTHPLLFCVCCGSGVQLGLTAAITLFLLIAKILGYSRRGSIVMGMLAVYALTGIFGGYTSSRLYKTFQGDGSQKMPTLLAALTFQGDRSQSTCTLLTALFFPGAVFGIFLVLNVFFFFKRSTACVPVLPILNLVTLWISVAVPLTFAGAHLGYKEDSIRFPTDTSPIARAIPPPRLCSKPLVALIVAWFVPLSTIYVQIFFIMTSLWMGQYYSVFGYALVCFFMLTITSAEVTLLLVYKQLCAENHRWWWFSFVVSGSTGFALFLYSMHWFRSLEAANMITTYLVYFGYMGLICTGLFLVTGTIGALTSLWFVKTVYSYVPKSK